MSRLGVGRARTLAAFGLLASLLAPQTGHALPIFPRITSVDPDSVVEDSQDVELTIEGSGFLVPEGSGIAEPASMVYANAYSVGQSGYLESTVISPSRIEAILPARFLSERGAVLVAVHNGSYVGGSWIPLVGSNSEGVQVTSSSGSDLVLRLSVPETVDVGDCRELWITIEDGEGEPQGDVGLEYIFEIDDLETPESGDGAVTLYDGYCEYGTPIGDTYTAPDDGWLDRQLWMVASSPATFSIAVDIPEMGLHAVSDPVPAMGGWISGSVTAQDGIPVTGAVVSLGWESAGGGFPTFAAFAPRSYGSYGRCNYRRDQPGPANRTRPGIRPPRLRHVATTDADGRFRAGVAPGFHTLHVGAPDGTGLASAWLGGSADAADTHAFEVQDRQELTGLDVALSPGGTFSGALADELDGSPIGGGRVVAVDLETGRPLLEVSATDDGTYRMPGLPPGSYQVFFEADERYLYEWRGGARLRAEGEPVVVQADTDTAGVDASMVPGAAFDLTVRAADSGEQLAALVTSYGASTGAAASRTDIWEDETWISNGLEAGGYRLRVDPGDSRYPTIWLDDTVSFPDATIYEIQQGQNRSVTASVTRGAVITGTVHSTTPLIPGVGTLPQPERWTSVLVWDEQNRIAAVGCSNANGIYETTGLRAGRYRIQFVPDGGYAPTWYGGDSRAEAVVVEVERGQRVPAEAIVEPGARIEGALRKPDGAPAEDTLLTLYQDGEPGSVAQITVSDDEGTFAFDGLAAGTYRLKAGSYWSPESQEALPSTWFPGARSRASAGAITVTGSEVGVVDATFMLGTHGRIEGSVEGTTRFQRTTSIEFIEPATGEVLATTSSNRDGAYVSPPLHPGDYVVRARGTNDRAPEYYGGVWTRAAATLVNVTAGGSTGSIDIALDRGTTIGGVVRSEATGARVPGVDIEIYDAVSGDLVTKSWAAYEAIYQTQPLAPGSYKVLFQPQDVYAAQWYEGASTFADATAVALIDADRTGVDAFLDYV